MHAICGENLIHAVQLDPYEIEEFHKSNTNHHEEPQVMPIFEENPKYSVRSHPTEE